MRTVVLAAVLAAALIGCAGRAPDKASRYVDPTFFGQHLEDFPASSGILTPPWPVRSIRLWDAGVRWCALNPARNHYTWAPLDRWLAYAARTGADLVYTFGGTPRWALGGAGGGCGRSGNLAPRATAWQAFVAALVRHANGRIKYFELWNEWESKTFWAGGVAPMVALADRAGAIIHGARRGLMLLTPSVGPFDGGGPALEGFLRRVARSSGVIDIISVHTYVPSISGGGLGVEAALRRWVGEVRRIMLTTGYAGYPLWTTEGGWGENSRFTGRDVPAGQRAFVARYDLALLSLGVRRAYWYAYGNPAWGTLWNAPGPRRPGGLTPAGIATEALVGTSPSVGWLSGGRLVAPCSEDPSGLWRCDIVRPGGYRGRILWLETGSRAIARPPGYSRLRTLGDGSAPVPAQLTVSTEPVLLDTERAP